MVPQVFGGAFRDSGATREVIRRAVGALALGLALATCVPAQAASCSVSAGSVMALKSAEIDPDVFVWDTKQRVVAYAAGTWRDTHDVLAHSLLAPAGTRAVVLACDPGIVRPKYVVDAFDAIGVRLVSGPNRGRSGWVTSQDLHLLVPPR